jgi:hypothetical protein
MIYPHSNKKTDSWAGFATGSPMTSPSLARDKRPSRIIGSSPPILLAAMLTEINMKALVYTPFSKG